MTYIKKTHPNADVTLPLEQIVGLSDHSAALREQGVYFLFGEIEFRLAQDVIAWILESSYKINKTYRNLTILINSPGGEVPSAFAIIDAIQGSKIPVHTTGLGIIASSGLMIFIAGKKGHRIMTPNTSILSHQFSGGHQGKQHELVAGIKYVNFLEDRMISHYKKCTGLSEADIKKYLLPSEDVWLNSKEALKYKLCDKVVREL